MIKNTILLRVARKPRVAIDIRRSWKRLVGLCIIREKLRSWQPAGGIDITFQSEYMIWLLSNPQIGQRS